MKTREVKLILLEKNGKNYLKAGGELNQFGKILNNQYYF